MSSILVDFVRYFADPEIIIKYIKRWNDEQFSSRGELHALTHEEFSSLFSVRRNGRLEAPESRLLSFLMLFHGITLSPN